MCKEILTLDALLENAETCERLVTSLGFDPPVCPVVSHKGDPGLLVLERIKERVEGGAKTIGELEDALDQLTDYLRYLDEYWDVTRHVVENVLDIVSSCYATHDGPFVDGAGKRMDEDPHNPIIVVEIAGECLAIETGGLMCYEITPEQENA